MPKPISPVHAELLVKGAKDLIAGVKKHTKPVQFTGTPLRLTYDERDGETSQTPMVLSGFRGVDGNFLSEDEILASYTHAVLHHTGRNKLKAAEIMKRSRGTVYRRMSQLGIPRAQDPKPRRSKVA